jgi:hypothetical protein
MKVLKNIALCLFMAVSVAGVSTTVSAATTDSDGRAIYTPSEAISNVLDKIKNAQEAIASNKGADDVAALVKEAKDGSKEINSEKIDRQRQKGNGHLLAAIKAAKSKNLTEASEHLTAAAAVFTEMKSVVDKK